VLIEGDMLIDEQKVVKECELYRNGNG